MRWLVRDVASTDDLDALLAGTIAWPGADQMRSLFSAPPEVANRQYVAVADGKLVGYAHCITSPLAEGGRAAVHVWVLPLARGQGIGSALWSAAVDVAKEAGTAGAQAMADVDDGRSLKIAAARGAVLGPRRWESRLDLAALSLPVVETAIDRVRAGGVELALFTPGDEVWAGLYEDFLPLHWATPDGRAGRQPPSRDQLQHRFTQRWQVLLAQREGATVGMTMAFARAATPQAMVTFFTGVSSSARGNGIATALKARHAWLLREAGWRVLYTWNMEDNTPILAANARLGFVRERGVQALILDFGGNLR